MRDLLQAEPAAAPIAWVVVHHRGVAPKLVRGLSVAPDRRRLALMGTGGPIISVAFGDAADFARCLLLGGIAVEPQRVDMERRLELWDGGTSVPSYHASFSLSGSALAIELAPSPCYLPDWDPLGAARTIILPGGLADADHLSRQIVACVEAAQASAEAEEEALV